MYDNHKDYYANKKKNKEEVISHSVEKQDSKPSYLEQKRKAEELIDRADAKAKIREQSKQQEAPKQPEPEIKQEAPKQPEQPKPVEVAKQGSGTMERIKQFGKDHKKGLAVAGAIAGAAALAGGAYYLHKKHKAKKAREEEEQNKSESFNVYEFDECIYITEATMDMLLEACDYELSEEEILENISEVINFYE